MPKDDAEGSHRRILAVVARVPRGRVTTYGAVAALAGLPGRARQVGYVLSQAEKVPWQRVVNASGGVSPRRNPGGEIIQKILLEREGVQFDANGRIDLDVYGWRPRGPRR